MNIFDQNKLEIGFIYTAFLNFTLIKVPVEQTQW